MAGKVAIGHQDFEDIRKNGYFYIDKTDFIREWWESGDSVTLMTRPRRFGKSVMASMLGAFFSKARDAKELFDTMDISHSPFYEKHLNKYNVIYMDFSGTGGFDDYGRYISEIQAMLREDLRGEYKGLPFRQGSV